MLDISATLEKIKAEPYTDISIRTPHTGVVQFEHLALATTVVGATGQWKETLGTKIATINRERNPKPINATNKGVLQELHTHHDNKFLEAGTEIAVVRHYLSKKEVISILLREALYLFNAPERAKYYFAPDVDKKIKISGHRAITVSDGMELFIVSRMKREVPLFYKGPSGVIFELYFDQTENVDANTPLIGVCLPDQLEPIQSLINRVSMEWSDPT